MTRDSSADPLLMHRLSRVDGPLLNHMQCGDLDVWIRWLLALCDLEERGSHSHLLPVIGEAVEHFFCQKGMLKCRLAITALSMTKISH